MPAEADSLSLEEFFSSRNFKVVVFNVGVILLEVLDVLEVIVDTIDAIVFGFRFCRALEVAQKIPILCKFFRRGILLTLLPLLSYFLIEYFSFAPAVDFGVQRHEIVDPAF
jgi:hypothetical protein